MWEFYKEHKHGVWGTLLFHIIILIIMLMINLIRPQLLPGSVILIDFSNEPSRSGLSGRIQAEGIGYGNAANQSTQAPQPESAVSESAPTPAAPTSSSSAPSTPTQKPEVMTQDFEKTAALESARKQKEEQDKLLAEARQKELIEKERLEKVARDKAEADRLARVEADRQAKAEADRLAKVEADRLAKVEAERLAREAEQRNIANINARAANAFGQGTGSGQGSGNAQGIGQGVSYTQGETGSGANRTESGSSSTGNVHGNGNGPSFSLAGRNALSLPIPEYPGNEEGIVVVSVSVDSNGKVTLAEAGVQGSNTYNANLLKAAREAALKSQFNTRTDAPLQKGTITYRFKLN